MDDLQLTAVGEGKHTHTRGRGIPTMADFISCGNYSLVLYVEFNYFDFFIIRFRSFRF